MPASETRVLYGFVRTPSNVICERGSPLLALHSSRVWLPLGRLERPGLGSGQRLQRRVQLDPMLRPVDLHGQDGPGSGARAGARAGAGAGAGARVAPLAQAGWPQGRRPSAWAAVCRGRGTGCACYRLRMLAHVIGAQRGDVVA